MREKNLSIFKFVRPLSADRRTKTRRKTSGFFIGERILLPRFHVIQHPIRQQRTELNQLLDTLRHMTPRSIQIKRQITDHGISRSQGFAEVGEQAFVIEAFHDGV